MPRRPILFTSLMLAAVTPAQDVPVAAGESAAEKAARAMAAMDALTENADAADRDTEEPLASGSPAAVEGQTTLKLPSLLPGAGGEGNRGIDVLSRTRLDMMVPAGRSHRGVHYPVYRPVEPGRSVVNAAEGGAGVTAAPMASLFESERVTRLDDDHVQFDQAIFIQYAETLAPDGSSIPTMKLEIERGVYDLKNEILMTNQPVRIETPQFVIEGDTMLHDRASQLTRFTRARMTFYNEEPEAGPGPAVASTDAAGPAPAAPVSATPQIR